MKIGIWSDELDQMALTDLALWTIRPRLMAVSGVANVAIWGQRDRQFQVLVDPDRLRAHGVTLDEVVGAAGDARRRRGRVHRHSEPAPAGQAQHRDHSPEDLAAVVVNFRQRSAARSATWRMSSSAILRRSATP